MRSAPATEAWVRPGADLLGDYDAFVDQLSCGTQAKQLRRLAARGFFSRWPDPEVWMQRPTSARLVDLARTGAWPFLTWCFVTEVVVPDLDLLGARAKGAHFSAWAAAHPDDVDRALAVAQELGWAQSWSHQVCVSTLALVCLVQATTLDGLDVAALDEFSEDLHAAPSISVNHRSVVANRLSGLRQVCFQLGLLRDPPAHPNSRLRTLADQVAAIPQPEIRRVVLRYLETRATTLRPSTVENRADILEAFGVWLGEHHPKVEQLEQLDRSMLEEFLTWNRTRPSRGRRGKGQPVSVKSAHQGVATLKTFFEDLALWGWTQRPPRVLLHRSDLPRLPDAVPRALPPDVDRDLMAGVVQLDDIAARCAIRILRGTGMRLGELLDLELDCLLDFAGHGSWVRVPLGKLATERTVPLDEETLQAFDVWIAQRGRQRSLPHPRTGRPADFLFMIGGRRMGSARVRRNLDEAARLAGLVDGSGRPRHVTPHQLRHTYGTELVNGGMSLQALMALLGHVTPEMTLRYASLASETVRAAYDDAIGKTRTKQHLLVAGQRSFVPEGVEWLHAEMIKTRVAHGYCSRHPAAGACPYATSANSARTSSPQASSALSSRSSWPTSWSFETMPPPGSGIRRSAATTV
ncbi:MAG: tyrosine-type recombinase/integrase [Actinomycetota bacterium]|nr:tyrosine-type recombinase/integrase [Actinomycetota bacterium]